MRQKLISKNEKVEKQTSWFCFKLGLQVSTQSVKYDNLIDEDR